MLCSTMLRYAMLTIYCLKYAVTNPFARRPDMLFSLLFLVIHCLGSYPSPSPTVHADRVVRPNADTETCRIIVTVPFPS